MLLARKLGSAYAPFVICRVLYLHAVSISCLSDAVFNSGLKVLQLLATFLALHPGLAAHQGLLKHFSALLLASQYSSPPRRQIVHRPQYIPPPHAPVLGLHHSYSASLLTIYALLNSIFACSPSQDCARVRYIGIGDIQNYLLYYAQVRQADSYSSCH